MASDLKAIVQKMIDAGESEDNIATVIKGYQSQPESAASHFKRGPEVISEGSSDRPLLDRMARPETASDIGELLLLPTVDATRGIIDNLPAIGRAAGNTVATVRDAVSGMRQPIGRALESVGQYVGKYDITKPAKPIGDAVRALGQQMAKPTVKEATDMLDHLHTATNAPVNQWELKFLQSVDQQVRSGRALSGAQGEVLQRIYKTVFP